MAYLHVDVDGETCTDFMEADGDPTTVRITNDAAENGYPQEPGPLTWLNSARITTDPDDDAVHCVVSVGDPRGGFCFTVRRMPDGRLVIHTPRPGEPLPHMETQERRPGTIEVSDGRGTVCDFSDRQPDDDDS